MVKMVRMVKHSTASAAPGQAAFRASTGAADERFEIRYEDENIWMSQKMLAAVYGVEVPNISYHLRKLFADAELDKDHMGLTTWEDAPDGKIQKYDVTVAKNYLTETEIAVLGRMVNAFLDLAELKAAAA